MSAVSHQRRHYSVTVEGLLAAACIGILHIWSPQDSTTILPNGVVDLGSPEALSLRRFIKQILQVSCTTASTLSIALWYIHKSRLAIQAKLHAAKNAYDILSDPAALSTLSDAEQHRLQMALLDPITDARGTFIAALQCAWEWLQDKCYWARTWAKMSGISIDEINRNEKAFLEMMDYNLYMDARTFFNWSIRLIDLLRRQKQKAMARQLPTAVYGLIWGDAQRISAG